MSWFRRFWRQLTSGERVESDLHDELRATFDLLVEDNVRKGMPLAAAERAARVSLGSIEAIKDNVRDARAGAFVATVARDVRFGARLLARSPLFAVTVIATVALGLGLNGALFTIFNGLVLRTDAVDDPHSLYRFTWSSRAARSHAFTWREYERVTNENDVFTDVVARRIDVVSRIEGRHAFGHLVSGNFFGALGVSPRLGRVLQPGDNAPGAPSVVVLSVHAWTALYGRDAEIIGRTIFVNGHACEVVGVAAEDFRGLDLLPADYWAPLALASRIDRRSVNGDAGDLDGLDVIGRLRPGVAEAAARAGLALLADRLTTDLAPEHRPQSIVLTHAATATPFSAGVLLQASPLFLMFGLVLVIACANVANLMLARGVARQREIGIRLALGASRARLIQQLLTESLLLSLVAAGAGLWLSRLFIDVSLRGLFSTMPAEVAEIIRVIPLPTDWRVVVFLVVAAVATTAMFGLAPALQATRLDLVQATRGVVAGGLRRGRVRSLLVGIQVAVSVFLLAGAAVLLRGAARLTAVDPGLRMTDTIRVDVEERSRVPVLSALSADPVVVALAASWPGAPMMGASREASASPGPGRATVPTTYRFVSADYFAVVGLDVVSGRVFTEQEADNVAPVVVVSQAAARRLWPTSGAVGQTLTLSRDESQPRRNEPTLRHPTATVVGVVRDVAGYGDAGSDNPGVYLPITLRDAETTVLAQVRGDPESARRRLTEVVTRIEPHSEPLLTFRTYAALQTYPVRVAFGISSLLGVLALALAVSGVYAVLSFLVQQRVKEIALRMALGAPVGLVVRHVVSRSLRPVLSGLAIGVFFAGSAWLLLAAAPFAPDFIGRINVLDAPAYFGSATLVLTVCVAAAWLPARRAASIDPGTVLRRE